MTRPEMTELDHLREVERLARAVVSTAGDEGWLSYAPDPDDVTAVQRAVNALARSIRHYHFPGDGCAEEEERPVVRLAGVVLLRPGAMPTGWTETYEDACARLGVEPRLDGWALWNTWGDNDMPATMIVSAVDTTEGLLANWSRGRTVYPVMPVPSQVALIHQGWSAPMILSPHGARKVGRAAREADPRLRQYPKKCRARSLTCDRVIDQHCDLRLSRRRLSALVVVERPPTVSRRPEPGSWPTRCDLRRLLRSVVQQIHSPRQRADGDYVRPNAR